MQMEVINLVIGINQLGHREILGFYVEGHESSNGWREVPEDLYHRGATEVWVGIFDAPPPLLPPIFGVFHCMLRGSNYLYL
ncbi:hypothetical protein A3844_24775 [Paenibacillus helianthi]|uniref:Uncharacterized protein n=1 Tax=Paenibacillus helianthi TaxID=1349432 RepID=A0ABX3EHA5_9BACL|nr:hypothetical protein A3844_24775 [Paenibacillus helianthi]